ncbi:hypothetical protein DVH05_004858 [Phytophthora capsici]|nr:hypothetical protein DVH05_004858 [Phytophthora capsici]
MQRPDIPLEIPAEDDSVNDSSDNDGDVLDEDKDGGEDFSWPELDQDELLAFAQDEAELSKMRKNGWELGTTPLLLQRI